MLYYICKYTPIEAFSSMGTEMKPLSPEVNSFPLADSSLHPNLCSFAKGAWETLVSEFEKDPDCEGIVLTTCCDSIKRLYDRIQTDFPDKFCYILDIPRLGNDFAARLYEDRIMACLQKYADFSGKEFREDALRALLQQPASAPEKKGSEEDSSCSIGLIGARVSDALRQQIRDAGLSIAFDRTCTGIDRYLTPEEGLPLMESYSFRLLNQFPCMRMADAELRSRLIEPHLAGVQGLLLHTIKFCDNFSFEYAALKNALSIPILQLDTDGTNGSAGQIRTRIEAFAEEISGQMKHKNDNTDCIRKGETMYILGIDSGSTSTNAVILNEKKEILAFDSIRTGAKSSDSAERILKSILQKCGLSRSALTRIISTGYGRVSIPFADQNITEITCHGAGAHFLNPKIRTILDIGGQDSKAIRLNEKGEVEDFCMNDKCAAGTGRFLEAMARTLELPIEELGPVSLTSKETVEISSMCTVFAESEVISLIALNKEPSDIAAGVHLAMANKAMTLLRKVGLTPDFMMTGGVAKNAGVVAALEKILRQKLFVPEEPEIVGALGAALLGFTLQ